MLLVAAANRRLGEATLSILIEWPARYYFLSNGPDVARGGFETTKSAGDRLLRNHEARFP